MYKVVVYHVAVQIALWQRSDYFIFPLEKLISFPDVAMYGLKSQDWLKLRDYRVPMDFHMLAAHLVVSWSQASAE